MEGRGKNHAAMELAAKVGIGQTIVSAIEKGTLKLSGELVRRFAVALEVFTVRIMLSGLKAAR